MTGFYPEEYTARSRSTLQRVLELIPEAILIGGWGTWVRTHGAMSHDIDLIVEHAALDVVGTETDDLSLSVHLGGRKWRATLDGIHLDLYVPYRSRLGRRLGLRTESLVPYAERLEQWRVLAMPAHIATKIAALLDRPDTMPGAKDRSELLELLPRVTASQVLEVIGSASDLHLRDLRDALGPELFAYLGETRPMSAKQREFLRSAEADWRSALNERGAS